MRKPSPTETQPYAPVLRPTKGDEPEEAAPAEPTPRPRRTTDPLPKLLTALRSERPTPEAPPTPSKAVAPTPTPELKSAPTPAYESTIITGAPVMDLAPVGEVVELTNPKPAPSKEPTPATEQAVAPDEAVATAWAIEGRLAALERGLGELVADQVPGAAALQDLLVAVLPDDIHPDVLAKVRVVPSKLARLMDRVGRAEARLHQVEQALDKVKEEEELRRRASPRRQVRTEVTFDSGSNFFRGFSSDLSDGGIFVATDNLLAVGTRLDLDFVVNGRRIKTRATVRWSRDRRACGDQVEPGMGLSFDALSSADKGAIEAFMVLRQPDFHVE